MIQPQTLIMFVIVDRQRGIPLAGPFHNAIEARAHLYAGFDYLPAEAVDCLPFDVEPVNVTIEPIRAAAPGSLAVQPSLFAH